MTAALRDVSPRKIGWQPYIYLIFLGFMLLQPLFFDDGFGVLDWAVTAALVAAFLPLYLGNFTRCGRKALLGIVAIALLGTAGMFVNTGSSSFFIYAAAGAPFVVARPRQAVALIAAVLALVALAFVLSPLPLPDRFWAFSPALFAPVIGVINIFEAEKERANARLRLAHDEIRRLATVAERERIARDLHDLLGHTLSVITLKSELAAKLSARDPARARAEMAEVTRVSRGALREVREAVRGYRTRDFGTELAAVKGMLAAAEVRFEWAAEPLLLPPEREAVLALALREAVTNVVRHAQASSCTVRLTGADGAAQLTVEDDGLGKTAADGTGLCGMRERIEGLGGTLRVEGRVEGSAVGTRLALTLPVCAGAGTDGEAYAPVPASPRAETP